MNLLYIALSIVLIVSCNNGSINKITHGFPGNAKSTWVQLIDSLGEINMYLPVRYDTSFSWINHSDCGKPCDIQQYRFQPGKLPITKESGWIWLREYKDSIERFTISHTRYFPFHDGDTTKDVVRHNSLKEQLKYNSENAEIIFDTIQKVHDRYFSIIALEGSGAGFLKRVLAVTTIKSNEIKFQFELLTEKMTQLRGTLSKTLSSLLRQFRSVKGHNFC